MGEFSSSVTRRTPVTQDRGGLFENSRSTTSAAPPSESSPSEPEDGLDDRLAYIQEQKRLETLQLDQAIDRLGQLFFGGQVSNTGPQAESLVTARGIGLFGDRGRAFDAYA